MKYRSKFKEHLLSGTVLVLCTAMAAGCGFGGGHTMSDIFGEERTLPDGDTVDFGNRHSPILNPSTNIPYTPPAPGKAADSPRSDAAPVPAKNFAAVPPVPAGGATYAFAAPTAPTSPVNGRHVPVENQGMFASNEPSGMSAPVVANISSAPLAAATAQATPTETAPAIVAEAPTASEPAPVLKRPKKSAPAAVLPEPVVVSEAKTADSVKVASNEEVPAPVASGNADMADSKYPSLASVPAVPAAPSKEQNASEFSALAADHGQSEASREQLMSEQNATVMTSPQTGQLVANPATAAAPTQEAKSEGGFNHWLHNVFHGKDEAKTAENASAKDGAGTAAPGGLIADATPAMAAASPSAAMPPAETPPAQTPPAQMSQAEISVTDHVAMAPVKEVAPNVIMGEAPPFPPVASAPQAITPASPVAEASVEHGTQVPAENPVEAKAPAETKAAAADATPSSQSWSEAFSEPVARVVPAPSAEGTELPAPPKEASVQPAPAAATLAQSAPAFAAEPAPVAASAPVAEAAPQPAARAPVVEATASAPPVAVAPALEPAPAPQAATQPVATLAVPVTPQAAVDSSMEAARKEQAATNNLPDISQVAAAPEAPITLTPPSQSEEPAKQRYLSESRYSGRRNQDDSTN